MKYKTTKKEVMENMWTFYCGYCDYQNILDTITPQAYTCGVYGWNADIYEVSNNIAIVTGYRPFGEYRFRLTDTQMECIKALRKKLDDCDIDYGEYEYALKAMLKEICWGIREEARQ